MAVLADVKDLVHQVTQTIIKTLYAKQVALLLYYDEKSRTYRSLGFPEGPALSQEDPFIEWIRTCPKIVDLEAVENEPGFTEIKDPAKAFFVRTDSVICVPLSTRHEFVGLLCLSAKSNLKPYNQWDLQLLDRLRVEAAIALSNASLYDRVMTLNAELMGLNSRLEAKVRERTREWERANRQLSESNHRIAEADRMKTQFLANMSHELRTPLTAIIGFSRIMQKGIDGPLTNKQREDLEAIHHSGSHLLGLISDLLDLSKIEAGKMELVREPVDLREVITGVMSTAQALIQEKGIEPRLEIDSHIPPVEGDKIRLRQVILNLVSNAIKFTAQGEVEIRAERRGNYTVISVRDTGCGIRKEEQDKLFEEFRQLQGDKGGTGLGLAISKKLVQLHGGEIWVESRPGEGSTFAFSLPVGKEARAIA